MDPSVQKVIDEAQRLLAESKRDQAQQILTRAVRHHPREPRYWFWLAQALDNQEYAVDALERALKIDPNYQEARQYLDRLQGKPGASTDWLLDEEPVDEASTSVPSPAQPSDTPGIDTPSFEEQDTFDFLTMEESDPTTAPSSDSAGNDSNWSFLRELTGEDAGSPDVSAAPEPEVQPESSEPEVFEWSILEELESEADSPEREAYEAETTPSQERYVPAASEEELWARVDSFLGFSPIVEDVAGIDVPDDTLAMASTSGPVEEFQAGGASHDRVERGAFSFRDVAPSPAAGIAVRNTLTPMTHEQVMTAVEEPDARTAPKKRRGIQGAGKLGELGAKVTGLLKRAAIWAVLLVVLLGAVWALLRNLDQLIPESVVATYPPIATKVVEIQLRTGPAPTPFPVPDWVEEAGQMRYSENNPAQATGLLRYGLESDANNAVALARLSELRRERPDGKTEALELAQRALDAVKSVEERALATEAFLWAAARQGEVDIGLARANADQAAHLTPDSPHAHWARAIVAALEGNEGEARSAAGLAAALSSNEVPGVATAKQAELSLLLGQQEEAARQYQDALEQTDYLYWRVALYYVLQELGRSEAAQEQLDQLVSTAPEDPAVQAIQGE